jgi:hypothetical protein
MIHLYLFIIIGMNKRIIYGGLLLWCYVFIPSIILSILSGYNNNLPFCCNTDVNIRLFVNKLVYLNALLVSIILLPILGYLLNY